MNITQFIKICPWVNSTKDVLIIDYTNERSIRPHASYVRLIKANLKYITIIVNRFKPENHGRGINIPITISSDDVVKTRMYGDAYLMIYIKNYYTIFGFEEGGYNKGDIIIQSEDDEIAR